MLKPKLEEALNGQLNWEMFSSYLYLSMSAYLDSVNLKGMSQWMLAQSQEEMMHAMKFYNYILERGGRVKLGAINEPTTTWESALAVFDDTCEHEAKVTSLINGLMDLALAESDHATNAFLQWFVTEQVEEEATVGEVRDQLRLADGHPGAMFMMDRELGGRTSGAAAGV